MKTFFITAQFNSRQQRKYVATVNDIDKGGFVDADAERFGFQSRNDAEQAKNWLIDYAFNKACDVYEDYERYHTRDDIASKFEIEEMDTDDL